MNDIVNLDQSISFNKSEKINKLFEKLTVEFKKSHDITNFSSLIQIRKNELYRVYPELTSGNLAYLFEHPKVINYIKNNSIRQISNIWHTIEKEALSLFNSLLECWAYYDRFMIENKYKNTPIEMNIATCKDEHNFRSEIIPSIETDSRFFYTLHSQHAMSLTDAIALINIEVFIIEQKWYEMLFCLSLSQHGTHFILYINNGLSHPIIVSTALIQNWEDRKNWLSFDEFFQGKRWHSCIPKDACNTLYKTGIFNQTIFRNPNYEYESTFSELLIKPESICEVLRLTVSGPKLLRYFLLYLCQKHLMQQLVNNGKKIAFTIIEQSLMLNLYSQLGCQCYINHSFCDINNSHQITYKGFWVTEELSKKLNNCDYNIYKRLVSRKNNSHMEIQDVK
ncbi:acyl-homoserine-lactone synthase [Celerinatantimonas sp. YJH-8]|uniref:acyl-homoserine-lactone synthase n=1 Tax=Celerinatantimonas sp. YJH-8 TaxID=3228714 RepID=UPI0038C9CA59